MKISAILAAKGSVVITVSPEDNIASVLSLLTEHHIGAVVVSPDGKSVAGLISERNIIAAMAADPDAGRTGGVRPKPVSSLMTYGIAVTEPDASIDEVMEVMTTRRTRHLPVVEDGNLVGIVSIGDIVKAKLDLLEDERSALMDYVTRGG
jgi:CBS domain-containing protein